MICKKCGHLINDDSSFCLYCGEKISGEAKASCFENTEEAIDYDIPSYVPEKKESPAVIRIPAEDIGHDRAPASYNPQQNYQSNYNPIPPVQQVPVQQVFIPATPAIPSEYRPLSAWEYFGYSILFSIPIVGFICLIIFSCSSDNINRRNYARSYWCGLIVALVLVLIAVIVTSIIGVSIFTMLEM